MRNCVVCTFASAAALLMVVTSADASSIAEIEAQPSNTAGLTITSKPVVTAILSQPGILNGRIYYNWAFLVNDGSGSMEIYAKPTELGAYTPTVGDAISATGTYLPYHQIPALSTVTAINRVSSGNTIPDPLVKTVAEMTGTSPLPMDIAGYVIELDHATISGQSGTFGVTDSPSGAKITDVTGSMQFYYWQSTFSAPNSNLFGQPVPAGQVNILGIVSVYSGAIEFNPISILPDPVPLPASAMGGLVLLTGLAIFRRGRQV